MIELDADGLPHILYERRTLPCGLDVIVHSDHASPQVCTSVWYRVGSSDEMPERTGFAHLFEHLFKNSAHMPAHHYDILRRAGSSDANASTGTDRTAYHEVVPAHELDLGLWLESDRMGYWQLDAERLAGQQAVVLAERQQRYINVPYGPERFALAAAMYPEGHPHRHLTIGRDRDISAATLDDAHAFYRTWYVPANATLVIAGDVTPGEAFARVERYFGTFPASQRPPRPTAEARVVPGRTEVPDRLAVLGRIHRAWLGPAAFADDEYALDLLTAAWCATGTGVLWRRLVYETQLAQRVAAWTVNSRLGGEIHVAVDLKTGTDPAKVRAILDDELAHEAESIERALTRREASTIWSLTNVTRRAQWLHRFALYTDEPDGLAAELRKYREVTPAAIAGARMRWMDPVQMIEVDTVPRSPA